MSELMPDEAIPWCPAHLLNAGETAIWWGRPDPRKYMFRRTWGAILVGVACVVTGGIVFPAMLQLDSVFAVLIGGMLSGGFAVFGVWMSFSCVRERYEEAKRVTYLVTDRRAVIERPSTTFSLDWPAVKFVELAYESGERGDVFFYEHIVDAGDGPSRIPEGFIAIANAAAVAREMRRLQSAAAV
jgi:hypothetical protein